MTRREAKQQIRALLDSPNFDGELTALIDHPGQAVITSLLTYIGNPDDTIRWRAVTALGAVVGAAAAHDIEQGRRTMRRLMWSLSDESGSIGWGAPEGMAEIMAANGQLAQEYVPILISYISEEVNFLEEVRLQQGVLWGLGRLAQLYPGPVKSAIPFVRPYLTSSDGQCRAMACWFLGTLGAWQVRAELEALVEDREPITFWRDRTLRRVSVGDIVKEALLLIVEKSRMC